MLKLGLNIRFLVIYLSFQINQFIDRYSKKTVRDTTIKYVAELKSPLSEGISDQGIKLQSRDLLSVIRDQIFKYQS